MPAYRIYYEYYEGNDSLFGIGMTILAGEKYSFIECKIILGYEYIINSFVKNMKPLK